MATCASPGDAAQSVRAFAGNREVLSLVGTLGPDGAHLHASLSDGEGAVVGGHLVAATVFTTAEVVVHEVVGAHFSRKLDARTGFGELVVTQASGAAAGGEGGGGGGGGGGILARLLSRAGVLAPGAR